MKYAQACITATAPGQWKIFIQSDTKVERCLFGTLDEVIREIRDASTREWEMRGISPLEGNTDGNV